MKEHIARWRKCEETLAKLLKEGKDTGDFAIEEKGKGEVWKKERKYVNQKKKRLGRRKYNDGEQYAPLEPSDSKEGMALGTDWALV